MIHSIDGVAVPTFPQLVAAVQHARDRRAMRIPLVIEYSKKSEHVAEWKGGQR